MHKYIIKRLLMFIPVLLCVTFVVFAIMELTPGDPARIMLGQKATEEAVQQVNEELGFDKPFLVRYVNYVTNALKGDFGRSYRTKVPVFEEIFSRFPVTLKLAILCSCVAILTAIPMGIISAVKRYSIADMVSVFSALLLASIPDFWLGLLLILAFSLKVKLFPAIGIGTAKHYILPTLTLSAFSVAVFIRMTRSTMLEVIGEDYIRTARAKGANNKTVIRKHAIRNAMIPVITAIGMDISALLGGTILVESVFGMPGVGTLIIQGLRSKDIPIVMGSVLFMAVTAGLINLIVDISYAYIDPRIKSQYKS